MHHSRITHVWILVALVAALASVSYGSLLAQSDPPTAKDPICGMTVKTAGAKFTSTYEGKTYYFCSETCKKTFDKEPAKYAAPETATDPICGMTVKTAGAKFTSTYEGKTYYFCSETCKKTFDKEPAKHVKK